MRIVPRVLECQNHFFESVIGDASFNNKKLTDFADVTQQKKRLTNSAFTQRAKQKWIARRVGAAIGDTFQALIGRMRCMTADLIVVDKLARLYDCPEDEMLCHVLVVIGRGASVVTLLARNLVARNPNKVVPTSVIRHQPLAIHAFPDALCRPSAQQRRPERQHRNTNSSISMMWGVCGIG